MKDVGEIEDRREQRPRHPAGEIEDQEPPLAQPLLHPRPEEEQRQHVEEEVEAVAVQEKETARQALAKRGGRRVGEFLWEDHVARLLKLWRGMTGSR